DRAWWGRGEPVTAGRAGLSRRAWKWVKRNPAVAGVSAAVLWALVAGSVTSAVYATRADRRAKEAAEKEREARNREEVLMDVLCLTKYQQARAVRLAGRPGWRSQALTLLEGAAELRTRPRDAANPDDKTVELPAAADLRGEAVMALIAHDIPPVRGLPLGPGSLIAFSPDGRFCLRTGIVTGRPRDVGLPVIDLATRPDVPRLQIT